MRIAPKMTKKRRKVATRSRARSKGRIDKTPPELLDAIRNGKCALFVGAGLSVGAGYPSWDGLLSRLIDACSRGRDIPKHKAAELRRLLKHPDRYLMVAQELSDRFGEEVFRSELVKEFSAALKPTQAHLELAKIPFRLVVTTNYDRLIETAYATVHPGEIPNTYTYRDAADFADALWKGEYFILKAHGDVGRKATIVVTERDYRSAIYRAPGYRAVLSA